MLTKWTDFDRTFPLLDEFQRRVNRIFSEMGSGYLPEEYGQSWFGGAWPPVDLYDTGSELMIRAEVPGLNERDIKITCNQNTLTITGERHEMPPEGYSVHRQERLQPKFSRSFSLPTKVDLERTTAIVKDGILNVTLAKAPEAQPRQITVKTF